MPELGFQALSVLFLLLPGFLCVRLVQALCVRSKQSEMDKIVEALLYSFLVYVVYALFFHSIPLALRVEHLSSAERYFIETDTKSLVLLALFSIALALVVAFLSNNDIAFSLLRKASITQRTSRTSLWSDVFHTLGGYVQVELVDGRSRATLKLATRLCCVPRFVRWRDLLTSYGVPPREQNCPHHWRWQRHRTRLRARPGSQRCPCVPCGPPQESLGGSREADRRLRPRPGRRHPQETEHRSRL